MFLGGAKFGTGRLEMLNGVVNIAFDGVQRPDVCQRQSTTRKE